MSRVHEAVVYSFILIFPALELPFCLFRPVLSLDSPEMYCKPWNLLVHVNCYSVCVSYSDHIFVRRVRNEEVLHRVKEERNIVHAIKRRNANWFGYILRRNCLLKHVIEGKLEG
jgi:hypothetical protein